jgi:type VI secretion system ImpJ/VasE family protein
MAHEEMIHWHEGLFLQPHHLQISHRHLQQQDVALARLLRPYPYGVVEAVLSASALENMQVLFDRLRVVMPQSGLLVSAPENAHLPALNIQEMLERGTGPFTIYLGVPLWCSDRANALPVGEERSEAKRLYQVLEVDRLDENTGAGTSQAKIQVRRINARLMLEDEDPSDMEVLPIMRVLRAAAEEVGLPRPDPRFAPPCYALSGSAVLRDMVRDLVHDIGARRTELLGLITRGGFNIEMIRGIQFEQMFKLRALGRAGARLSQWVRAPLVTPFEVFVELQGLLAELAALHPDRQDLQAPDYDHDNPYIPFADLTGRIRSLLPPRSGGTVLQVRFVQDKQGLLVAQLSEEHLTRPNEYFIGIKTRADPGALAKLVENPVEFKVMPYRLGRSLVYGIPLVEERSPPLQLPYEGGIHYFRLVRAEQPTRWQQIVEDRAMSIWWPHDIDLPEREITLYMPIP